MLGKIWNKSKKVWKKFINWMKEILGMWIPLIFPIGGGNGIISTLENACVAQYKMNDNLESTEVINSKGAPHGTAVQFTSDMHVDGKIGGALTFDGTSNYYVDTNQAFQSTFQNSFTVSLWCKPTDGQPGEGKIMLHSTILNNTVIFRILGGKNRGWLNGYYRVGISNVNVTSNAALFINGQETWHLVSMVVEKLSATTARILLYFDGILVKTGGEDICTMSDFATTNTMLISDTEFCFVGPLDDVRIFNRALNSEEIAFLYGAGEDFQLTQQLDLSGSEILMSGV